MIKGIDVSYWQGEIDFEEVAKSVDFVVLREGYRKTIDTKFVENVRKAEAAGLPILGVYHFIYTDSTTISQNAQATVDNIKKAGLDPAETMIFADLEYDTWKKNGETCTRSRCSQYTGEYLEALKKLGCKRLGIYMNNDYYRNYYTDALKSAYPIWLADYSGDPDYNCILHQYTSSGQVDGISGSVDMNWLYDESYLTDDTDTEEGSKVGVTAQDVLAVMRSWLGYSEANGKYRQIIDLYNSHKPLARGYKVQYGDAWCDTCVSAAAIKAGAVDLIGTECGCEEHIKIFRQKGIWIEDGTITPEVGDIIVYNWDATSQPNNGYSDHIGYVENVHGKQITAIEGNKNDSVARRTISVGDPSIRGYARPHYATTSSAGGNTGSSSGSSTSGTSDTSGAPSKTPKWVGEITQDGTPVRTWAGATTSIKSWPKLNATNLVDVCDVVKDNSGHDWYYVRIAGQYFGFVDSNYVKKAGSGGGSTDADTTPDYVVGKTYTLQVDALRVRTGAGTGYAAKSYSQLTSNARTNAYSNGTLRKGTRVTCQAVQAVGENIWIRIPSGWIAAYYNGKAYVA